MSSGTTKFYQSNAEVLHSIPLSSDIPKDGQRLAYSSSNNQWIYVDGTSQFTNSQTSSSSTIVEPLNYYNTFYGSQAGQSETIGVQNTGIGNSVLQSNTTSSGNTAVGYNSMQAYNSTTVSKNTAIGLETCSKLTNGVQNTCIGADSLSNLTSGDSNIAIGSYAGQTYTNNKNNIILGRDVGHADDDGVMRLGTPGYDGTTKTIIQGVYGNILSSGVPVQIQNDGTIGIIPCSTRYKENIVEAIPYDISRLKVYTYNYKSDPVKRLHVGLIAEEVDEIYPELVGYDSFGLPNSIDLLKLVPILLHKIQEIEKRLLNM